MSENTGHDGENIVDEVEDDVVDYGLMTEAELRERHAALSDLIDELREQPRSIEVVQVINDLRAERNLIVETVRELQVADEAIEADLDFDAAPVSTDEADAASTTTDEVAEASAATTAEDATIETQEAEVSDDSTIAEAEGVIAEALVAGVGERPVAPTAPSKPVVAYHAGAGQSAFSQGSALDLAGLGRAFESMKGIQPGADGRVTQAVVAALPAFEDTHELAVPVLSERNTAAQNDSIIGEAVEAWRANRAGEPLAHTAAICDPLDIIREIPEVGVTDTPFANLFPQRPIGRLGFTYTPAAAIADTNDGIAVWTEDDQSAVDPDDSSTWKPCVDIACSSPVEVKAKELTTCATVDTMVEMSSPERVREFLHLMGVQRARRREQHILDLFDDTASGYTFAGTYGTLPSLIQAVHTVLPQLLYAEREDAASYDLVLEPGFVNKLIYDEHNKAYTDPSDALATLRSATGLNVTVLRDFVGASPFQTPPTAGGGSATLAEVPDTNRVRIVPAGSYIYAATGEESTGWQTDPQLARQNKRQVFSAEYVLLAKHSGAKAAFIDITSAGDGSRACCAEPFGTEGYSGS
jgi:hypothetical protein